MKVCLVTGFPPNIGRGAESSWLLADELAKDERITDVYVLANKDGQSVEPKGKITIFRIWQQNSWGNARTIFAKIKALRPDVVHIVYSYVFYGTPLQAVFFTLVLFPLLKINRIKTVVTIHQIFPLAQINKDFKKDFHTSMPVPFIKTGFYALNKAISSTAAVIITLHRRYIKILASDYGIKNTHYIPIGFKEIRPLAQDAAKSAAGVGGRYLLLFSGFIVPFKGVEYAIEAMSLIKGKIENACLVVAGTILPSLKRDPAAIAYIDGLEAKIKDMGLGDCVIFKNHYIAEDESALLFSAADLVILPYCGQSGPSEIFKKAVLYKIPMVASDIDYLREDIADGVIGLLVPPRSPEKIAEAVLKLHRDKAFYNSLRENIEKISGGHDIRMTAKMHVDLYQSVYERRAIS